MKTLLLDTHTWVWGLYQSHKISRQGRAAIKSADALWVSAVSFYEVAQKVRLGKWSEMEPFTSDLRTETERQLIKVAAADAVICLRSGLLEWTHRDPFDRIIAATALHYAVPLISADTVFDGVVSRIW